MRRPKPSRSPAAISRVVQQKNEMQRKQRHYLCLLLVLLLIGGGILLLRRLPFTFTEAGHFVRHIFETEHHHPLAPPPPSLRGSIYDRNLEEMAVSYQLYTLQAHPAELIDRQEAAKQLAFAIGVEAEDILKRLESKESAVELAVGIDAAQAQAAESLGLLGVSCKPVEARYYPNHAAAGRLLGFVSEDAGLSGAEALYDPLLQPGAFRPVETTTEVDFAGETNLGPQAADLLLTLDLKLQKRLEQELEGWRRRKGATSGSVIALDPETGRLLAAVRQPGLDPNYFWQTGGQSLPKEDAPLFPAEFFPTLIQPLLAEAASIQEIGLIDSELPATVSAPRPVLSQEQFDRCWHEFSFDQPAQDLLPLDPKQPMPEESVTLDDRLSAADIAIGVAGFFNSGKRVSPWFLQAVYDPDRQRLFSRNLSSIVPKRLISPAAGVQLRRKLLHESPWASQEGFLFVNSTVAMVFKKGLSEQHLQDSLIAAVPQELPRILLVLAVDYGSLYPQPSDIEPSQERENLLELGRSLLPILAQYVSTEGELPKKPPAIKNEANLRRFLLSRRLTQPTNDEKDDELTPQVMPDVVGLSLRQALRRLNPHKLRVQINGSGRIVTQKPAAKASLTQVNACELTLKPLFQNEQPAPDTSKPAQQPIGKNTPRSAGKTNQPNHP